MKKAPLPLGSCSLLLYPEGAQTENSISRGSNLKGHKPLCWISVNLSDTFKTQMKQKKHSFCVAISRKEKDGGPINYFLYDVFDHGWYGFQLKYWWLFLVSAKFRCQILLKGISDGTNMVIYHVLTIKKSEKKFLNSVSRFAL